MTSGTLSYWVHNNFNKLEFYMNMKINVNMKIMQKIAQYLHSAFIKLILLRSHAFLSSYDPQAVFHYFFLYRYSWF